jgi:sigma-B regulation protein RsbU (phosphoserine phosphatase)
MRRNPYLLYFGLLLLFLIAIGVRVRDSRDQLNAMFYPTEVTASFMELKAPNVIGKAGPDGKAAGLQDGDILLEINGRPYRGYSDLYVAVRNSRPGDPLRIHAQRISGTAATVDAVVPVPAFSRTPTPLRVTLVVILNAVIMPIFCVALGFWVAAVRIRDPLAWILLFLMLGFSCQLGNTREMTLFGFVDWFQPILIAYQASLINGWPISMMLFGLYFPGRLVYDRRWPFAKWLVLAPLLLHLALNTTMRVLQAEHAMAAFAIDRVLQPFDAPLYALGLIAIGVFFFGTGAKLAMTENRDARRRLSLLLTGTAAGLTPILLVIIKDDFFYRQPRFSTTPEWLIVALWLPVFLFPVTLAYLIVVQRALDVRVVVRQSVQYLLAKNSARILQIVFMSLAIFGTAYLATAADPMNMRNHPQRILLIAEGLIGMLLVQRVAERLRHSIDRKFFREDYNAELLLSELADKVRTIVETRPLLETVGRRISESLHITKVALLLPKPPGIFEPEYAMGYSGIPVAVIPEQSETVKELRRENRLEVYADDETSWIYRPDVGDEERRAVRSLESQLLLPLTLNQKLLGIISLGPKQSEAPFSKADLRLLSSVAIQTGLALENSRLAAEVAAEAAQRERINRELEIAREVQERLFPQDLPQFPGLDYAGCCRPALGVGGDYYDFIQLSDHELGIAIGDVSGKGFPAALMMASLRASLRGQIIGHEMDLTQLMANVNTLVYEGSTSNRYATFFYARFDVESRELTYVNAGHNPPLIVRGGSDIVRLDVGGPVVGLLPGFPYQQATIVLQPSDLLIAFTDGISEAMNEQDQEWGEDRLIECVQTVSATAEETMRRIIAAADAFVGAAKQHDDMTIIVARID